MSKVQTVLLVVFALVVTSAAVPSSFLPQVIQKINHLLWSPGLKPGGSPMVFLVSRDEEFTYIASKCLTVDAHFLDGDTLEVFRSKDACHRGYVVWSNVFERAILRSFAKGRHAAYRLGATAKSNRKSGRTAVMRFLCQRGRILSKEKEPVFLKVSHLRFKYSAENRFNPSEMKEELVFSCSDARWK